MNNLTETKIAHFHRIINTLKAINKIMVNESEVDSLIKKTCQVLTQTRGYYFSWIGLFNQENKLYSIESSGKLKGFDSMKNDLLKNNLPKNFQLAIQNQQFMQLNSQDHDCPMGKSDEEFTWFVAPIQVNANQYGIMCSAVPVADAQHPKEAENYTDIAKNIGFALNGIQEKNDMAWLLGSSSDGIITFDYDLNVVSINKRFCELFNCNEDEIVGQSLSDLAKNNIDKKTHKHLYSGLNQITKGHDIKNLEFTLNGKIFRVETQVYELKNYRIFRIQDITREQTEKIILQKSETKYRTLVEGLNDALFILQDGVVKFVNRSLCSLSGYTEQELLNKPFTNFIAQSEIEKIQDRYIKRLKGKKVDSVYQSAAINKQGKEIPVEVKVIPVEFEDRPAHQIILHDITIRQNTMQKLKESEERYRFLAESGFEGILIHKNGTIVDVNEAMTTLSGYTKKEIIGQNIFRFLKSEDDVKLMQTHMANKSNVPYVVKAVTKTRKLVYIEIESKTMQYNGEKVRIAGVKDVTERQQLNQNLRDTKNSLNNLLNNLPGMAYTCLNNKSWEMIFMSGGCTALTGYSPNKFINNRLLSYSDIIHPAYREKIWNKAQEAIANNKSFELEYRIICKNGQEKWVWERGRKTTQNNQEVLEGFITDITERKKAARAFMQSQTKYRTLFNAINDAVVIHDYEKEDLPIVEVNDRACQLYGYKRDQLITQSIKKLSVSYAADLKNNAEKLYETKHLKADGNTIPVEVNSSIFKIGNDRMVMSMIRDISQRKEAEKKLSDSEHLLDTILESMPSGFVMLDEKGCIIRVNERTCQITGYRREQLEGQRCNIICPLAEDLKHCPVCNQKMKSVTGIDTFVKCNGNSQTAVLKNVQSIVINGKRFILESFQDVTQWKIAKQQLIKAKIRAQESEQKFSAFMNSLPGSAFIKDKNFNFQYVNQFMERNMEAGQWIGKHTKDVVHPDIVDNVLKDDELAFRQGRHKYEEKFPVIGRGMRDFLTYKFTIGDDKKLLGGISIDITERKQLESRNTMLSQAIEASPVSVVITDIEGNIEYVNPFFEEKTGYTLKEVIGGNPRILKSGKQSISYYTNMWNTILSGKIWRGEFQNKKKNGEIYWEKGIISPVTDNSGEIAHFIAIKEDITGQRQILLDLKKAKEEAEKSDKLKSAFLANMSHEIRTPMNGIIGFTELLKDPNLSGEQQNNFISIIQQSGNRMLSTINDIIDISKIESGLVTVELSTFELKSFLNEIKLFFTPEATQKQLYLEFTNSDDTISPKINSDAIKLNGIITNLIKNAIKFTDKGGISFGYQIIDDSIQFFVKDTGVGIPKNRQQAIFHRFVQADIASSRVYEGSGLGLSISKSYTEMLGGSIHLESETNKGTTFFVTFPYKQPSQASLPADTIETKPRLVSKNLKILIAEDDPVSVSLLKIILKKNTNEVLVADNGKEAVDIAKANPDIDLILMDIRMPIMDGIEATERIREFNNDVKIIAQTAFAQEQDIINATKAGCNSYITKPINANNLGAIINNLF